MKIAYVLSGQPRYVLECAENQNNYIDYLRKQGNVVHVYAQAWDECEVMDSLNSMKKISYKPKKIAKDINRCYRPLRFKLQNWQSKKKEIKEKFSIDNQFIHNLRGQHIALIEALGSLVGKYDIIIKSRYDLLFGPNLHGKTAMRLKYEFEDGNKLVVPNIRFSQSGFWNDVFFIGSAKLMLEAFNYNNLRHLTELARDLTNLGYKDYVNNMFEGQNHVYAQLFSILKNNKMDSEVANMKIKSTDYKLYRYWFEGIDVNNWENIIHFHPTRPVDK